MVSLFFQVSLQQTSQWVNTKFSQLMKVLAEKQEVTQRFLDQQEEVTVLQAEKRLAVLEERQKQLAALQNEISSLCSLSHCQLIKVSLHHQCCSVFISYFEK